MKRFKLEAIEDYVNEVIVWANLFNEKMVVGEDIVDTLGEIYKLVGGDIDEFNYMVDYGYSENQSSQWVKYNALEDLVKEFILNADYIIQAVKDYNGYASSSNFADANEAKSFLLTFIINLGVDAISMNDKLETRKVDDDMRDVKELIEKMECTESCGECECKCDYCNDCCECECSDDYIALAVAIEQAMTDIESALTAMEYLVAHEDYVGAKVILNMLKEDLK